jgi:hypothetical protein
MTGDSIMKNTRENNPNWRGGKSITSHGYVLVRVGTDHPLSDVRGYAYEHRIVAIKKLGRMLKPNEKVHHIDGNKKNNVIDNICVVKGNAEHYLYHRKNKKLRKPNELNLQITCECGCGLMFQKYDKNGRPRRYVSGHNLKKGKNEKRKSMVG